MTPESIPAGMRVGSRGHRSKYALTEPHVRDTAPLTRELASASMAFLARRVPFLGLHFQRLTDRKEEALLADLARELGERMRRCKE